jgi:hypothetical protein
MVTAETGDQRFPETKKILWPGFSSFFKIA